MSRVLDLITIVDRLRSPDGCPWDQAQTLQSMRPYLLEECYELLDAIDSGDALKLREELGDLLFEVVFLARLCQEGDPSFGIDQVADAIATKMVDRHPHVFHPDGDDSQHDDPGSIAAWEARKHKKNGGRSRLDGVPRALPSLLRTHRQSEKAASVGFDWVEHRGVIAKVREELAELEDAIASGDPAAIEHEYGDALMALGNLGRKVGSTPEEALRTANDRLASRFGTMEQLARDRDLDMDALDMDGLESLWQEAKRLAMGSSVNK